MTESRIMQVRAEYHGQVDLGAPCFSIPITDLKPNATVRNRVMLRSRIAGNFVIGNKYDVELTITETPGHREFEVTNLV